MATVRELLARKGPRVQTVEEGETVLAAIQMMNEHRIGALVVTRDGRLAGMFTERDVLRRVIGHARPPAQIAVAEVMTADVCCCAPETTVDEASRIMKEERVRHLPVCDAYGNLLGLVSIGDVNAYYVSEHEQQILQLQEYVYSAY
ncbi:MAG TPA: CBS domain-containing protein [Armatimonadota bacterium]|nr:CBS domain-containing protein [Armatimonadota bacterium]